MGLGGLVSIFLITICLVIGLMVGNMVAELPRKLTMHPENKACAVKVGLTPAGARHPNISSHTAGGKSIYIVVVYQKSTWQ